jgi:hypothetical protein
MGHVLRSTAVRLALPVCAAALTVAAGGLPVAAADAGGRIVAREARKVYLQETAQLKLSREEGIALVEHGQAAGTYNAPMTVTLTIHPKSVTAVVTVFPKGGSISGIAQANYVVKASTGYYGGTFTITHGTGAYRHASGKALGISGTVNRYTFEATVKAHGPIDL